jgi:hypothetical protein
MLPDSKAVPSERFAKGPGKLIPVDALLVGELSGPIPGCPAGRCVFALRSALPVGPVGLSMSDQEQGARRPVVAAKPADVQVP